MKLLVKPIFILGLIMFLLGLAINLSYTQTKEIVIDPEEVVVKIGQSFTLWQYGTIASGRGKESETQFRVTFEQLLFEGEKFLGTHETPPPGKIYIMVPFSFENMGPRPGAKAPEIEGELKTDKGYIFPEKSYYYGKIQKWADPGEKGNGHLVFLIPMNEAPVEIIGKIFGSYPYFNEKSTRFRLLLPKTVSMPSPKLKGNYSPTIGAMSEIKLIDHYLVPGNKPELHIEYQNIGKKTLRVRIGMFRFDEKVNYWGQISERGPIPPNGVEKLIYSFEVGPSPEKITSYTLNISANDWEGGWAPLPPAFWSPGIYPLVRPKGVIETPAISLVPETGGQESFLIPLEENTYEKAQGFKGTVYEGLFHLGRDYCVKKAGENEDGSLHGTTVYPIGEGIVVDLRFNKYPAKDPEKWKNGDGVGNYVTINHGNGIVAVYMHLAKVEVSRDQKVTAQTPLGETGDIILHPEVPDKMCPHLHLEIRKNGVISLHVPPNQRYGYISQDGTTKIVEGERIENVLEWIDLNFYNPDSILATRKASPDSTRRIFTEPSVITTPKVEPEVKVVKESEIVSDKKVYTVQVGGFSLEKNALSLAKEIKDKGYQTYVIKGKTLYKVQVGEFKSYQEAQNILQKLKELGYYGYITTRIEKVERDLENMIEELKSLYKK